MEYQQRKTITCRWYPKVKMNLWSTSKGKLSLVGGTQKWRWICGVPAKENYPLSVVPKSEDESDENFSRFSSIFECNRHPSWFTNYPWHIYTIFYKRKQIRFPRLLIFTGNQPPCPAGGQNNKKIICHNLNLFILRKLTRKRHDKISLFKYLKKTK